MGFKSHGDESIFVWESIEFEIPFSQSDGNLTFFSLPYDPPSFPIGFEMIAFPKLTKGK